MYSCIKDLVQVFPDPGEEANAVKGPGGSKNLNGPLHHLADLLRIKRGFWVATKLELTWQIGLENIDLYSFYLSFFVTDTLPLRF